MADSSYTCFYCGSDAGLTEDGRCAHCGVLESQKDATPRGVPEDQIPATDAAREAAAEKGVPLDAVEGSGAGGRVTKSDVEGL